MSAGIDTRLPPDTGRVLVVMINPNLGNCCFALPLIEAFGQYFEQGIDLLIDENYAPLAGLLPSRPRILAYPCAKCSPRRLPHLCETLKLSLGLPGRRYRAVLDIGGGIRAVNLVGLTFARQRYGFRGFRRSWVYNRPLDWGDEEHRYLRYAHILQAIGRDTPPPLPPLQVPLAARDRVRSLLRQRLPDPSAPLAVIHPGAGYAFRRWPEERFAEVAARLVGERGCQVALIGTPAEQQELDRIRALSRCPDQVTLLTIPLVDLVALFDEARILISNESGPTHLAALTRLPIVTLFGPTKEDRWRPIRDERLTVLRGAPCDPACRWGECAAEWRCLLNTSVDDVLDAVDEHLAGGARAESNEQNSPSEEVETCADVSD